MPMGTRQKNGQKDAKTRFWRNTQEEGEKNNNTNSEYMNGKTEKLFSVIPDKTSPSVQDNDKMIMTTKHDSVKTYKDALLG